MTPMKCYRCHRIIQAEDLEEDEACPVCHEKDQLRPMCPKDHSHCSHPITPGIAYCPLCNEPMCPECGSHDVVQISRVTGYLQEVSGWNAGKQQELKDRVRYNVTGGA